MKKVSYLLGLILLLPAFAYSQEITTRSPISDGLVVNSDFWTATDGLGRKTREYSGKDADPNKFVGMFYWTWHQGGDADTARIKNISQIKDANPDAVNNYNDPMWRKGDPGYFYWEEPLYGYYRTTDTWVLRKHAELLADAKIDVVFFDCTNGSFTWDDSFRQLMSVWDEARKDGVKVPKISFLLPFSPSNASLVSLRHLYRTVYQANYFPELWFKWNGKPLIMAYQNNLTDTSLDIEIKNYFTFRPGMPDYVYGPSSPDQWGWLEVYPQHGFAPLDNGKYEQCTVGIAQNTCAAFGGHCSAFNLSDTYGRSYSKVKGFDTRKNGYLYGWNFEEQWDRADEIDPKMVFVTGWNEFVSGQWLPESGWTGKPFSFVDEYDWDHSRDIEPVKNWGDNGDVYYLQLVDRVRKFKGMKERPIVSDPKTIDIANLSDWGDVKPAYNSYKNNTKTRNSAGRCEKYYYDESARNDIISSKIARDNDYVYIYVQTNQPLTDSSQKNWMMLFLDIDRNKATGWQGYDYVINHKSPDEKNAYVEKSISNSWNWQEVAKVDYVISSNKLVIKIPRSAIGLSKDPINIEFKWCDNMQEDGNIMDFYVSGDVAPGGRFNYVYDTTNNLPITSIKKVENSKLFIYPSPCENILNVGGEYNKYEIYTTSGSLVLKGVGNKIDVSSLSSGIYAIKTNGETKCFIKK